MANVWKVYCEHPEGETPSMILAGLEFSLRQEAAMSRWIKGCRPSELALVRNAARDEMLSWAPLSTTGRLAHDLIRAEPPRRFLPREFPVWRPHLREWIQTCRWLFREAQYFHSELVWGAVERQVSPLDILIGLSHLPGFEDTLEDLARQHHLLSDEEDSSSEGMGKIKVFPTPDYRSKQPSDPAVPKLPSTGVLLGPSKSGKTVALISMILEQYRGCFERIYIFSPSINVDDGWRPVKQYIEETMKVPTDQEQVYFEDWDEAALRQIIRQVHGKSYTTQLTQ
ncbi:unnamed protein product, partial [Symbiodinium sp. KB8]